MKVEVQGNSVRIHGNNKDGVIIHVHEEDGTDTISIRALKGIFEKGCGIPTLEITKNRYLKTGYGVLEEVD